MNIFHKLNQKCGTMCVYFCVYGLVYVHQVLSYHASAGEEETRALEVTAVNHNFIRLFYFFITSFDYAAKPKVFF